MRQHTSRVKIVNIQTYLTLVIIIALGTALRFWNLDLKPLWLDEVITALFSLGRSYNDVPLETVFPFEKLKEIFSFNSGVSCAEITQTVASQSTHPPLFFCLMYSWVSWLSSITPGLIWSLRSLPALFGVGAIAAVFWLNSIAFSASSGLMVAALMAVSPFAIYLSQEARHYTLPLLLITLALVGLLQIQQDLVQKQQLRWSVWLGWAIANSIGLYVHYFFILALIAELVALSWLMYCQRQTLPRHSIVVAALWAIAIIVSFIPWLPVMLEHFNGSETSWLPHPHNIAPIYQTLLSWLLIFIALPVENQPLWIAIPLGFVMLCFGIWVARQVFNGLKQLVNTPATRLAIITLGIFTLCVLIEFLAIVYLLRKDLTIVPRYNFVYYPSLLALIAAGLVKAISKHKQIYHINIILIVAFLSCVLVVFNFVFQKPFSPQLVAQNMNQQPDVPLMLVVGYTDYQNVALGLSFALELEKIRTKSSSKLVFLQRSPNYDIVWQKLSQLPPPATSQLNLWVVAPGLKQRDYPIELAVSNQTNCHIETTQHYRIGIPYQLYRCD